MNIPTRRSPSTSPTCCPRTEAKAKGVPYRLAADRRRWCVPVNKVVRVLVTGADVIHAFAVPAFGVKIDAIPGRVNETWFKADRTGIYYGQCSRALRRRPRLHADRGPRRQPARVRRLGRHARRPSPPPRRRRGARRAAAAAAAAPAAPAAAAPAPAAAPAATRWRRRGEALILGPCVRWPTDAPPTTTSHDAPRPQAGLLHPLVLVDQPQGHRHPLHPVRHHGGPGRRRCSPA